MDRSRQVPENVLSWLGFIFLTISFLIYIFYLWKLIVELKDFVPIMSVILGIVALGLIAYLQSNDFHFNSNMFTAATTQGFNYTAISGLAGTTHSLSWPIDGSIGLKAGQPAAPSPLGFSKPDSSSEYVRSLLGILLTISILIYIFYLWKMTVELKDFVPIMFVILGFGFGALGLVTYHQSRDYHFTSKMLTAARTHGFNYTATCGLTGATHSLSWPIGGPFGGKAGQPISPSPFGFSKVV